LVKRLYEKGISDPVVLRAMQTVERHKFVDSALASQAYEDTALPIGYGQTISQPFVVAKTISVVRRFLKISKKIESNKNIKVLEIGFGSGYQASVLSNCFQKVVAIERIFPLFQKGLEACNSLVLEGKLKVIFGDGNDGLKSEAPFDAIFFSAALDLFPNVLRGQLNEGGVIIAPTGSTTQHLLVGVNEKGCEKSLVIYKLDAVSYVPVKRGVER
jgi:protein-L-isoaspartate(D-aspartate) O-methyltransferase